MPKTTLIEAQVVLQNCIFERFLARLSQSEYRDKFVIKGGMLIAAIVSESSDFTGPIIQKASNSLNEG